MVCVNVVDTHIYSDCLLVCGYTKKWEELIDQLSNIALG